MTPSTSKMPTAKRFGLLFGFFVLVLAVGLFFWRGIGQDDKGEMVIETAAPKVYTPVVYDVEKWQSPSIATAPFSDDKLLTVLGATARKEKTLDFVGNQAESYHYHNPVEAPLYVIDSDKFFEIAWYYASPKDSDEQKAISQAYAKSAYTLIGTITPTPTAWVGEMLAGKTAKRPDGVALAQCKNYLCQVVFDKDKF